MSKNFSKWKNRPIPRFIRQMRNEIKTKEIGNILNGIKTKKICISKYFGKYKRSFNSPNC